MALVRDNYYFRNPNRTYDESDVSLSHILLFGRYRFDEYVI